MDITASQNYDLESVAILTSGLDTLVESLNSIGISITDKAYNAVLNMENIYENTDKLSWITTRELLRTHACVMRELLNDGVYHQAEFDVLYRYLATRSDAHYLFVSELFSDELELTTAWQNFLKIMLSRMNTKQVIDDDASYLLLENALINFGMHAAAWVPDCKILEREGERTNVGLSYNIHHDFAFVGNLVFLTKEGVFFCAELED